MNCICGVDISKDWLDCFVSLTGEFKRFANTPKGVEALAAFCKAAEVELVVMEASGGYEKLPFLMLWRLGQPCALANARSVRNFAVAMGALEKTDRIDAEMIARFALAKPMVPTFPPSEDQQKMAGFVRRLAQVTSDISVQKQRKAGQADGMALDQISELLNVLNRQSKALVAEIARLIDADPLWSALNAEFRTVKGVADKTVAYLLAEVPEIGTYSNRAISKLVGLAPLADDSGKRQGTRSIRGGRAAVRSVLFLVADIARKYDPSLAAFKERLLTSGKTKMVARIALARKLLVRLNAKARDVRRKRAMAD
jgi:transposase